MEMKTKTVKVLPKRKLLLVPPPPCPGCRHVDESAERWKCIERLLWEYQQETISGFSCSNGSKDTVLVEDVSKVEAEAVYMAAWLKPVEELEVEVSDYSG